MGPLTALPLAAVVMLTALPLAALTSAAPPLAALPPAAALPLVLYWQRYHNFLVLPQKF